MVKDWIVVSPVYRAAFRAVGETEIDGGFDDAIAALLELAESPVVRTAYPVLEIINMATRINAGFLNIIARLHINLPTPGVPVCPYLSLIAVRCAQTLVT